MGKIKKKSAREGERKRKKRKEWKDKYVRACVCGLGGRGAEKQNVCPRGVCVSPTRGDKEAPMGPIHESPDHHVSRRPWNILHA